jgi:hypothetical protein
MKPKLSRAGPSCSFDDSSRAMPSAPATQATPGARSGLRHSVSVRIAGSRAFVENPRLFTVRSHKPPIARGHRAFTGKQEWR